ncbi:MAG: hypothetical protein ACRBN8_03980 [Nannocystales bacterium]
MASASHNRLRRWDHGHWADWVVPAVVASLWALLLAAASDSGIATRRGLVFVGGPVLLLSGLHARITGYLHAPSRAQLLVLPIPAAAHFRAARARHLRGLAETLGLGSVAVLAGLVPGSGWSASAPLVLDWAALAVIAALFEPMIPAASAALGRRFESGSWTDEMQRRAGGGWTLPETSVHLYAPAAGIGLAAAAAMPLQLAFDLSADGREVPAALWGFGFAAIVVAGLASAVAARIYALGMFEAVPFVAEATRTLAGPPIPEPTPPSIARLKDPVLRLLVLGFWRETPVPALRLLGVVGATGLVAASPQLGPAHVAVWVAAALLWLVPATALARIRPLRARMLSTLPLPPAQRDGTHPRALALLWSPVLLGTVVVLLRVVLSLGNLSA